MAIAKAQTTSSSGAASGSSIAIAFANAQTAGNSNVLFIYWNTTTVAITSVSDSKGNSYTQIGSATANSTLTIQAVYYCPKIVAATAGSNTVTVVFASSVTFPGLHIIELSGGGTDGLLAEQLVVTASNANSTSANAVTTGSFNVSHVPSFLMGFIATTGAIITAGSGYTLGATDSNSCMWETKNISTTGSQTLTATASTSNSPFVFRGVNFYSARNATVSIATGNTATLNSRRLISSTNSIASNNTLSLTPPVLHNATLAVASRTTNTATGGFILGGLVVIASRTTQIASARLARPLSATIASASSMVDVARVLYRTSTAIGMGTSMLNGPRTLCNGNTSIASRTTSVDTAIDRVNAILNLAHRTQMVDTARLLQSLVAAISGRTTETATSTVRLGNITDTILPHSSLSIADRAIRNGTINIVGTTGIIAIPFVYRKGIITITMGVGTALVDRVLRMIPLEILTQCQISGVDRVLRRTSIGIAGGNAIVATYSGGGTNTVVILGKGTVLGTAIVLRGGALAIASKNVVGAVPQWARLLTCAVASRNTLTNTARAIHQANVAVQAQIQEILTDRELARSNVLVAMDLSIAVEGTQKATLIPCTILTRCQMVAIGNISFLSGAEAIVAPASPVSSRIFAASPLVVSIKAV